MVTPRNDWLELTTEESIDPDLPICDPHHPHHREHCVPRMPADVPHRRA